MQEEQDKKSNGVSVIFFVAAHLTDRNIFLPLHEATKMRRRIFYFFFKLTKRKQNSLCHLMISLIWFSGPESSAPSDCVCNFLLAPKESCHQVEWFHFNWKIFFLLIWIFVVPVHFLTKSLKCGDWGETWWDLVTKMGLDGTWWLLLDLVRGSLKNFFFNLVIFRKLLLIRVANELDNSFIFLLKCEQSLKRLFSLRRCQVGQNMMARQILAQSATFFPQKNHFEPKCEENHFWMEFNFGRNG